MKAWKSRSKRTLCEEQGDSHANLNVAQERLLLDTIDGISPRRSWDLFMYSTHGCCISTVGQGATAVMSKHFGHQGNDQGEGGVRSRHCGFLC